MNSSEPGRPGSGIALHAAAPEVVAHALALAIRLGNPLTYFSLMRAIIRPTRFARRAPPRRS